MKQHFRKLPQSQIGSFYSTVIIVAMFGIFLTAALKLAPAYMDNGVVVNTMEGIAANNDLGEMTITEIRADMVRSLGVNNVALSGDAINVVEENGQEFVDIIYETKVPLFYNISALVSFNNRFEKN
jgi:hypothetical protein